MPSFNFRNGRWLLSATAIVAIPLGLLFFWFGKGPMPAVHAEPTEDARQNGVPLTVRVIRPQVGGIVRTTTQPGNLEPYEYENLYAKVPGFLMKEKVDIGTVVKQGDLLAEIEAPELHKDRLHAKAALAQANSQVKQMDAHVDAAKAELEAAKILIDQRQAEVKRAVSNLTFREKRYDRIKMLADYKSVELSLLDEQRDQLDAAQAWKDAAMAGVHSAVADVEAKKAKVMQAQADLEAAKANVQVAEATLQKAQVFVQFTKIRSHYDGVITARNYHDGDFIKTGSPGELPLFTVQCVNMMRLVVWLPDFDVPFCREGDPVDFTISTLPQLKLPQFKVSRMSRSQDLKTKAMRIEVDVPNDQDLLRDGMYGAVTIHFKHFQDEQKDLVKSAVTVPASALRNEGSRVLAFVVRDKIVHQVAVQLGTNNGTVAEVLTGLHAEDDVINHPSAQLQDGMEVRVVSQRVAPAAE
jgi:RND family efflux transporter MFP subunit